MKNYDLFVLAETLSAKMPELMKLKGAKFTYGLTKNLDILEAELKIVSSTSKPNEAFTAYDKERVALCEKFAKKNEKGEPVKKELGQGQFEFDIDTESEEWLEAIAKIKETNKTVIEDRDAQVKKYNELLDVESTIKFHMIDISDVDNDINGDLMRIIKPFIKA